ncbi:MAG: DNA translocase FtsK 4TM domain-containing protein, partial [Microthrixaceae bacterium]
MATSQSSRKRSPSRKSSSRASASKTRSGGSSSRRGASDKSRSGAGESRSPFRLLFDGRGHDVWGLVLVALGAISALGIWFSSGAIVGRWADSVAGSLLGLARMAVPVALVVGGVLLIRGPRELARRTESDDDATDASDDAPTLEMHRSAGRVVAMVAGGLLAGVVIMGFAHLIAANDTTIEVDGFDAYRGAGGLAGAGIASTLEGVIGTWGTAVVLLALAVLAISLIGGWTLGQMARFVSTQTGPALSAAGTWLAGLFKLDPDAQRGDSDDGARPSLYDQDADGLSGSASTDPESEEPERKPKRARKRKKPTPAEDVATEATQLGLDLASGDAD